MADFDDFSIANRPRPTHGHPKKKRLLSVDILQQLTFDHPQSIEQHSVAPKSPQPSRESPANYSVGSSTLSSSYSLSEQNGLPCQGVNFAVGKDPNLPAFNNHIQPDDINADLMSAFPMRFPTPPFTLTRTMAPQSRSKLQPELQRGPGEHDLQNTTIPLQSHHMFSSPASPINGNTISSNITGPSPKLQRSPPESAVKDTADPPKSPLPHCLSLIASPTNGNINQPDLPSPNNSRVKSPADNNVSNPGSSLTCPEADGEKSPLNEEDRASPDPNCAICLGNLKNKSFTDSCLHQFCFKCLVQWSKVKPECPLCKQGFKSIIHNVRSNEDYDQYHCRPAAEPSRCRETLINELLEFNPGLTRFRYRTTMTDHRMSLSGSFHNLLQSYVIPPVHRWPNRISRRQLATQEFRSSVYRNDMWVERLPDVTGRFRDTTPEFYSANQAQLHRLVPWLNREIPCVLIADHVPPAVVVDLILSLISRYPVQSPLILSKLRPYFGIRTGHFLHEFFEFARSPYDLIGFDQAATYGPNPNPSIYTADVYEYDSSSSDSDIICLETEAAPVAGPSGLNRPAFVSVITTHSTAPSGAGPSATTVQPPTTVLDDSDDCEIVDYVKPRHERTPEVVVLSDTDEDTARYEPSTSEHHNVVTEFFDAFDQTLSDLVFSPQPSSPQSTATTPSSDSEYVPYSRKRKKDKAAKLKCRKGSTLETDSKRYRKVPSKSRVVLDSSDSDEDLSSRMKKRKLQSNPKIRKRNRQISLSPRSPLGAQDSRIDLPGTSGFLPRQFDSDDSLEGHSNVVIPFLQRGVDDFFPSPYLSTARLQEHAVRTSDSNRSPVASTSRARQSSLDSDFLRRNRSPLPDMERRIHSRPKPSKWCIKPSDSDPAETFDEQTTTPTSSPENPPRLKSIVIMRNPNDRDSSDRPPHRRQSRSPVASTSRSSLWSSNEASYERQHYRSPSGNEESSSSRGKTSKHKCKSKSGKKDRKKKMKKSMKSKSKKCKAPSWYRPRDSDSPSSG